MPHVDYNYEKYWESCWNEEDIDALFGWLQGWNNFEGDDVKLFREFDVKTVCDAACGFGSHTLSFASNGFEVSAFDVSPKAVELTVSGLRKFGYDAVVDADGSDAAVDIDGGNAIVDSDAGVVSGKIAVKQSSIMDTGYADNSFDAVTAYAVLDHLTAADAKKALAELLRITKPGGLLLFSFDTAGEEDYSMPHETLSDGSMVYVEDSGSDSFSNDNEAKKQASLLFRPHNEDMINDFVADLHVIRRWTNRKGDQIIAILK